MDAIDWRRIGRLKRIYETRKPGQFGYIAQDSLSLMKEWAESQGIQRGDTWLREVWNGSRCADKTGIEPKRRKRRYLGSNEWQ